MTDLVVVSLLPNRHLCAELTFHQYLKMLGEEKTIINVNLKKSLRQISHPVTDLKMELAVKIVNDFKNC